MKIGYPCINWSLPCRSSQTFRLKSFSEDRFLETVASNLACLRQTLEWNVEHRLMFFRITSDVIPFGSHPVNQIEWWNVFQKAFQEVGSYLQDHHFRISMHPGQYTLLNAPDEKVLANAVMDLEYHARVLDLLGLDTSHKVQIHVGGVYGDKEKSMERFVKVYKGLPSSIRTRLVIENDERSYSLQDCLKLHKELGIPVLLDTFHHSLLNEGETLREALQMAAKTWKKSDGVLMVDYSSQQKNARFGMHAEHIDGEDFKSFLESAQGIHCDVMLEIKDKEKSALEALQSL
ncbi:MAG: UV DNA damage repair endonuclease UvsE [Candidatus Altimarinota bacterium]